MLLEMIERQRDELEEISSFERAVTARMSFVAKHGRKYADSELEHRISQDSQATLTSRDCFQNKT